MENRSSDFEDILEPKRPLDHFPLLELPFELVIRIVELAVQQPKAIMITSAPQQEDEAQNLQQPALCRVSRLLRGEIGSFYRLNDFEAYHYSHLQTSCILDWLVAIGPSNRKAMEILTLHSKYAALATVLILESLLHLLDSSKHFGPGVLQILGFSRR
jgi:hypothetical protein